MNQMWQVVLNRTANVAEKEAQRDDGKRNVFPHTHYFDCFYYDDEGEPPGPYHCPQQYDGPNAVNPFDNSPTFNTTIADFEACSREGSVQCTLRYVRGWLRINAPL
jgi:hypothetical protein